MCVVYSNRIEINMSSSSSSFSLLSLIIILVSSSLFTNAAAVRPILNGRIHFSPPTNDPVYIPRIGRSTASRSPVGNAVSSRSYIPSGDSLMLPNNPITRSPGVKAVSSRSYIPSGDGLMLPRPRGSLGNNPIARSPGGNAVSSRNYIPGVDGLMHPRSQGLKAVSSRSYISGGDGLMLPRVARSPGGGGGGGNSVSTTGRSFVGSPGGNAIPVGRFMLHERSLMGYIPIDMLGLPSPSAAYVVEREPPSKPSPPTCRPRC